MKNINLSKEVVLLLIPFLFTASVNSLSTFYSFKEKRDETHIKLIESYKEAVVENKIETHYLKDRLKLQDNILKRQSRIIKLYLGFENEEMPISIKDKKFLYNSMIDLSKDLGNIRAYKNLRFKDSLDINYVNDYLNTEKNFINSIFLRKKNDSIFFKYLEYEATEFNSLIISEKTDEINNVITEDNFKQSKILAKNLGGIAYLNLIMFFVAISAIIYLISYSIKKQIFSKLNN